MAATIRDVAALAGVSPSTVSRTCQNSPAISEKTKEKVREAMAALGYEPPAYTDPNKTGAPRHIGVIMPPDDSFTYDNPFFLQILAGITQGCSENHYLSVLVSGKNDQEALESIQRMIRQHEVSSFVVLFSRREDPIVDYLACEGIDYVLIGHPSSNPNDTVAVDNDNIAAGQEAARYLAELGHKKIGFFGPSSRPWYSISRANGLRLYAAEHGLDIRPEWIVESDSSKPERMNGICVLLKSENRPTAFIASDEMYALALRQACAELGLRIPEDLSILTFNNSIISRLTNPQMTSVDINAGQLGVEAALQAIKHNENPDLMPSRTLVPFELVVRQSTAAPASRNL